MKVVLDTNFILTCVKQKIDFFSLAEELFNEELEFFLPEEDAEELESLSQRKGEKGKDKANASLALKILENKDLDRIVLGNKDVDEGLVYYIKNLASTDVVLATLDKDLRKRVNCKILTIEDKKSLKIL
jgi:rRNA-processing protein FCF1